MAGRLRGIQRERVGDSRRDSVHTESGRAYKKMDFDAEFVALLKKHGMEFDPKYVLG